MRILTKKAACIILPVVILMTGFFVPMDNASAAKSKYSTSGVTIPSDMYQGKSFAIRGKIYSKKKIKKITVGIVNKKGRWVRFAYANAWPNAKSYDLSRADAKIPFGKLSQGNYRYRVRVYDSSNRGTNVVNRFFRIRNLAAENVSYPNHLYYHRPFTVKGKVKAKNRVRVVKAGITSKFGIWLPGKYKTVHINSSSFDLNELDSDIPFSLLNSGTYYYRVDAKASDVGTTTLVKKRFTVSRFKTSSVTKPGALSTGKGFVLKGKVRSTFKISRVCVGIKSSSKKWKSGFHVVKYPKAKSFNVASVDSRIKFGKLSKGTYYYCIWSKDVCGKSKMLVSKKFTVGNVSQSSSSSSSSSGGSFTGKIKSGGQVLGYKSYLITSTIGAQPYSGPCGIYAMAYVRAVRDGYFSKGNYGSVHSKIISVYGHGTSAAYWYEAGGVSTYYSSARSCYKKAISEVANGRPCIINLHNGNTGNNHYVTVIGYVSGTTYSNVTLNKLIVLDPGYGAKKYLSQMNYYNSGSPQCITFSR